METIEKRPRGRRPRTIEPLWNAHLFLREDQRATMERLSGASGITISETARRALDRGLPLLEESR